MNTLNKGICPEKGGTMKTRLLYLAYSLAVIGALVAAAAAPYWWG